MRIGVQDDYKGYSVFDADQLSLKKDEVAVICCIEPDPTPEAPLYGIEVSYAHWLDFPKGDRRMGYHKCQGRYEVIFGVPGSGVPGNGADPEMCDGCKYQAKGGKVGTVCRRFATNVMRYLTDNRGNFRTPLQADCVVWRFGDDKYNRLLEIRKAYGDPKWGIRVLDLRCVCEQEQYQRFAIDPMRDCLWVKAQQQQNIFAQQFMDTWKTNRVPDLSPLLCVSDEAEVFKGLVAAVMGAPVPVSMGGQAPLASPAALQSLLDGPGAAPSFPAPTSVQQMPPPQPTYPPMPTAPAPAHPNVTFISGQPVPGQPPPPVVAPPAPPAASPFPPPPPAAAPPVVPVPMPQGPSPLSPPPAAAPLPAPTMPPVQDFEALLKL